MIINKIHIISFAGLKDKIIDLTDGINLIYGENEKGKSTIQNFIRIWLYGMSSKRSKDIKNNDRVRYMPIDGDKIRGELYVFHNGRKYIIRRSFGTTKKEDIAEVLDAESGEVVLNIPNDEPGKYFFNVNSSTFVKTLFIGQLGVSISKDKEEEIIDKAANLLGSGEEKVSVQKALEKLEVIKKSLTTSRKTGELDLLRNKYNSLIEERYEGYKLSEDNIEKEQRLINLKEKREELRKELKNLDIYKKYMKKIKLQKEYEEITEYLKKREELIKKERYIEESISSKNGVIDEGLLNDIKDENSLYLSILDMYKEAEEKLINSKEMYIIKKNEFKDIFFIDDLSIEDKNKFIKSVMEQETLNEKIKSHDSLIDDINTIKNYIQKKKEFIGSSIKFNEIREEVGNLLEKYEDKLKELKFKVEHYSHSSKDENISNKIDNRYKYINIFIAIVSILLTLTITIIKNNLLLIIPLFSLLIFLIFKFITLKIAKKSTGKLNSNIVSIDKLEEAINEIEKEIFRYTKVVGATSYEDFIRKLKLFDEFTLYEEKQNIKINEKEIQLSLIDIKAIKNNYRINDEYINYILDLAQTSDVNQVICMLSEYEKVSKEILSIKIDIEKEEESIKKLEKELAIREKRIREKLEFIGLENIDLFNLEEKLLNIKEKISQRHEIIRSLKSIEETYKALTKDKDIETIKEDLKDIINENINYTYSSEEEIDKQVSLKSNELIEVEKTIKDVENDINNRFIGKRSIPQIEEDIEEVKENINKLEIKLKAIELAIEKMNEALREVRGNFGNILNSNVRSYFKELTAENYDDVMVSDSYEMKVRKGVEVLPGAILSNGANDQLYLSLRLAFIYMIYKDIEFPVILDDAFIQYDDNRTEKAIDLIVRCNFKQLIIFTCQIREESILINKNIESNYIYL
jgi:DNA repair protein SbcC/Rad50